MNLNRTGSLWDRNERIKINDNWDSIERFLKQSQSELYESEAFSEWLSRNDFKVLPAVEKESDLPKSANKNDVIGVKSSNIIYIYNGSDWIEFTQTNIDSVEVKTLHYFDFNNEVESLSGEKSFYVSNSTNGPTGEVRHGFVSVLKRPNTSGDQYAVTFVPYNSEKIFKRLKTTAGWRDWTEITGSIEDTGWIDINFTKGNTNTAYVGTQKGFKTAYRIIKQGNNIRKMVRINGSGVDHTDVFLKLPTDFVENSQVFFIRTHLKYVANVTFDPSGDVRFYLHDLNKSDWVANVDNYIYGEFEWNESVKKIG